MSASDKALALIAAGRIRLDREQSSPWRYVFRVVGDSEPFAPYTVTVERDGGLLVESCSCPNGQHHPIRSRCSHAAAARLVLAAVSAKILDKEAS